MRFFFCVDNNFKLWIKYFLVRFNVDKTLKYNSPYPTHVIYHTYKPQMAPLEGSCRIAIEGGVSKCYTNRATNGRPYAHVISIHKGAVALRQVGGFIRDIQSGRPMVAPTHVISIHKAPLEGSCRIVTEGWLYIRYTKLATNGRPYTHVISIHKAPLEGSCRFATEGWLLYNLLF